VSVLLVAVGLGVRACWCCGYDIVECTDSWVGDLIVFSLWLLHPAVAPEAAAAECSTLLLLF
jgi:hypothetical protein